MFNNYSGLTTAEARQRLEQTGPNRLHDKKKNYIQLFFHNLFSLVSLMFITAAILSLYSGSDTNFWVILFLFFSNFGISFWHERKADRSIKQLQSHMILTVSVCRDGRWQLLPSVELVIGDIIELKIGALVPADVIILESKNLSINESVLTGESLPKGKIKNDLAYSGSYVTTGSGIGQIKAVGDHTFFGQTVSLVDPRPRQSALEKDILSISKFISIISLIIVVILTLVLLIAHSSMLDIVTLDLSLLIAGIPVALPTVMGLIISIGILNLTKKQIVVRRLASLEDLANVDLLISDKTGTLTQNSIKVEKVTPFGRYSSEEVIKFAFSAIAESTASENPLTQAVLIKARDLSLTPYIQSDFVPGDSERKRSTAVILVDNKPMAVSLGAPRIIESLCQLNSACSDLFKDAVETGARDGFRSLAVAINQQGTEEKNMTIVGLLFLADTLYVDARSTIKFMGDKGIDVKMLTGDSLEISKRISQELGLKGEVYTREIVSSDSATLAKQLDSIATVAEVLPGDKYTLVSLARQNHVVAMTGDGVNDLPAVKNADVGFAVSTAVDALKSVADIVLLKSGISVIKDAIIEAREIFARLYNYSVYRISESFRIIITIAVIGLIYKTYPLTPVQLILLAFLNDVPIISLAFDRVKTSERPAHIDARKRFTLSSLFGLTGTVNSLLLLFIMMHYLHLSWSVIQTVFFLKLTVSGHMLVYVAHTQEKWFKFLPSKPVLIATIGTQLVATLLAFSGFLTAPISIPLIILVWVWSFFWMQISELMKRQKWLGL